MTRTRIAIAAALMAATIAMTGCAGLKAKKARQEYLTREFSAMRYHQPLAEIWPAVRKLLAERGFELAGKDAESVGQKIGTVAKFLSSARELATDNRGRQMLETDWNGRRKKYRVEGWVDEKGSNIIVTLITREPNTINQEAIFPERDTEMELDLAHRLNPEQAARIEAELSKLSGELPADPSKAAPAPAPSTPEAKPIAPAAATPGAQPAAPARQTAPADPSAPAAAPSTAAPAAAPAQNAAPAATAPKDASSLEAN